MIHIVGAGLTGATLARLYAESGERVTVWEKAKSVGGLCADFEFGGTFIPSFGPHFFHTNDCEIISFMGLYCNWDEWIPYTHRVLAKVGDKHYPFPVSSSTFDYFGPYGVWENFIEGYTVKQWGVSSQFIDSSVLKRVPKKRTEEDDRYFTDRFQAIPKNGYTHIIGRMLDHENIKVKLGEKVAEAKPGWIWTGRIDKAFKTEPLDWRCLKFKAVEKKLPAKVVNYPGPEPYTREHQITESMVVREYPGWSGKKCYPMPTEANRIRSEELKAEAKRKGIILAGRMGTYSYLNMDQAIRKAMDLFKELTK